MFPANHPKICFGVVIIRAKSGKSYDQCSTGGRILTGAGAGPATDKLAGAGANLGHMFIKAQIRRSFILHIVYYTYISYILNI